MDYDELKEFINNYNKFNSSQSGDGSSDEKSREDSNEDGKNNFNYGFFYNNESGYGCNDMPGGFQRINPLIFIVIGDILGDLMSGKLPFNVQNAIGNWIQLVGQAIETYSSQQQYFQSGPGRYYSPQNLNITNSTCPSSPAYSGESPNENNNDNSSEDNIDTNEIMRSLCTIIDNMKGELEEVKERISIMEKNKN